jgi:hypothetical protein
MARNLVSQSRSVWLERDEYPGKAVSSAAKDNDGLINVKLKTTAAKRRMQDLSVMGSNYIEQFLVPGS